MILKFVFFYENLLYLVEMLKDILSFFFNELKFLYLFFLYLQEWRIFVHINITFKSAVIF